MVKLTPKFITTESPNEKLDTLQKLALLGKDIEKVLAFILDQYCLRA